MLNLPNAITLTRIALVVVFTAAVSVADRYSWGYLAALVTFILAACTDWLDGYLARRLNQVTTFGKLIDPLADKIAVSAAFIYLTGEGLCPAWITILIISREFLVTGLRQIAQDHGVIIPAGTSGKWKTAFQLAFCIACLLALTWTHTPEYLPSITDRLAALCLWHGSGASNLLYQVTLWGSVILTVYSGAVYCAAPANSCSVENCLFPHPSGDRGNIVHSPGHFIYREHDFIPPGSCMKECMRNLPLSPFLHMLKPWNVQAVHPLFRKMNASTALKSPYLSLTLRSAKTFKGSSCLPEGLALI